MTTILSRFVRLFAASLDCATIALPANALTQNSRNEFLQALDDLDKTSP